MSGKIKGVFVLVIMLTLIFGILGNSLGSVMTEADAIADNTSYPPMISLIFGYWWVPFLLLVMGLILGSAGGIGGVRKRFGRRRR